MSRPGRSPSLRSGSHGRGVPLDLVPPGAEVRLAPPRLRVHPAKPKVGLRTTRADEMWHIDTTVIRLLDGTRAYVHAEIDNLSRRILAWRVADTFAPVNSVAVLLDASRGARPQTQPPSCWQMQVSRT
jgi:transposase InsO family protein